jgi:fucose permease
MLLFQALMVAALLVMGMGIALLGTIKVELARRLAIDEAKVGGLISLFGFTIIPVILGAGYVTDMLGKRLVLVAGCGLIVASMVILARARGYATALAGALLLGAGWSAMVNVGNVLTPLAFTKEVGDTAFATNLANVFFGAGAFLTPLGLVLLVKRTSFTAALLIGAALAAIPGILALTVDIDQIGGDAGGAAAPPYITVLSNPVVWLCGLAYVCYFPMEASMAGWTTTFLIGREISEMSAARLFSGFWLAYLAARLATAFALGGIALGALGTLRLPPDSEVLLITVLSAASAVVLLGMTFGRSRALAALIVVVAGFTFGPIFPTVMAVLLDHTDPASHGRAVGIAIALGGLGSSTMPLVIGASARRTSLQRAFLIAVALGIGLTVIALVLRTRVG